MKKRLLTLILMAGTLTAHADDYAYLTFETSDGAKVSVPVGSLTISISGTTLTAGDKTFVLTGLSKMYFTASNVTTGIPSVTAAELDEAAEIYDLKGRRIGKDQLKAGVYVIRNKNGNYKIVVK